MTKTYTLSDGTKVIFEYNHNGVGKITLESMDILMSLLKATAEQTEPQTDEYCDYCKMTHKNWYEHCDICKRKPKDEPQREQAFCGKCRYLYRDFQYGLSCYRLMDNEPCKYEERKDEPQTDCVKVGKWYSFTDYVVEMQGENKLKAFRIVPQTDYSWR